jgi:hypothetical protein
MTAGTFHASGKKKYRGLPRTEVGLMNNVLGCLQYKDSVTYFNLFLPFDTLWSMVMHNPDHTPETVKALNDLKEHPQSLIEFDPYFNHHIIGRFIAVLQKGEDSGIHWKNIVMQRYELHKQNLTRDLKGYDKIAPERFKGYMFVRDLLGRLTFCITITEIQKINGYFFGGQVINILEAGSVDEYLYKEGEERKYFEWLAKHPIIDSSQLDSAATAKADSLKKAGAAGKGLLADNAVDDDNSKMRKEVVDRKYYEGKFDDEIPVKLYVRYMKDLKGGKIVAYDGLYKFGDQTTYSKLTIIKQEDGKWLMEDDPPVGTLELELKNKTYTGSWTNNENQTGYDVVLTQADLPQKKLEQFEMILERNMVRALDESVTAPEKQKSKKELRRERRKKARDEENGTPPEKETKEKKEKQKDKNEDNG